MMTERQLEITRTFDAPRELVFQVWTESEHLAKWWGPKGTSIHVAKHELRPKGIFHYSMTSPDGHVMWGKFIYQEIVAPVRLVFLNGFSDAEGNTVPAPFGPDFADFPLQVSNVVTFTQEDNRTIVKLNSEPYDATPEQHEFFRGMFDSMRQGFGGTFDQLEQYLLEVQ
ncbi:SRPBCC family protein [Cohnella soli]|uniref:SRPBCC domain-containing protein n=1 Tax=Cohnella soli TaxID=425005 RepID=A0ABW0HQW2_9BACL